jgi:hypothetical protein
MLIDEEMIVEDVIEDIDIFDRDDPLAVAEYVNEIYANLREREVIFCYSSSLPFLHNFFRCSVFVCYYR